ncbi:hypothetical protein MUP77_15530 [Candidatus Bathyarchaeota archaeon]|nr:hypothetical protein [Candidatus Bathyarchaeota archaeon]
MKILNRFKNKNPVVVETKSKVVDRPIKTVFLGGLESNTIPKPETSIYCGLIEGETTLQDCSISRCQFLSGKKCLFEKPENEFEIKPERYE